MQNASRALFVALICATGLTLAACSSHKEQDTQQQEAARVNKAAQPDATQQQVTTVGVQTKLPRNAQEQNGGSHNDSAAETPGPQNNYEVKSFFSDYQQYRLGDIVPDLYRSKQYHITDYKVRHLPAPLPGSHWTYMGGNYVLISDAEGKILRAKAGEIFYH